MRPIVIAVTTICAIAISAQSVRAQEAHMVRDGDATLQMSEAARTDIRRAKWDCWRDALRYCGNVPRGGGRIMSCLNDKRDVVSSACRPHLEKARTIAVVFDDCADDVDRFCATEPPGDGRVVSCLSRHKSDISKRCQSSIGRAWQVLGY